MEMAAETTSALFLLKPKRLSLRSDPLPPPPPQNERPENDRVDTWQAWQHTNARGCQLLNVVKKIGREGERERKREND